MRLEVGASTILLVMLAVLVASGQGAAQRSKQRSSAPWREVESKEGR